MKSSTSWPWSRKYSAIVRPGEADAQARARRLVHLPVDERDLVDHARLGHLEHQVGALARALADAREHRDAAVLLREVVDQLLDQHRLADAGAAEQPDLAALDVRRDQVDALEAGLEDLDLRREVAERRRIAVDRPALDVRRRRRLAVDRLRRSRSRAGRASAARRGRRSAGPVSTTSVPRASPSVESIATARTRSSPRCCCTSATSVPCRQLDLERAQDLGKAVGEDRVDDDALDLDDLPDAAAGRARIRHEAPLGVIDRAAPGRAAGDGV